MLVRVSIAYLLTMLAGCHDHGSTGTAFDMSVPAVDLAPADPRCPALSGLIVSGAYANVIGNYDNCPAIIDANSNLSTVDALGNVQQVADTVHDLAVRSNALFLWYGAGSTSGATLAFWNHVCGQTVLSNTVTGGTIGAIGVSDSGHAAFLIGNSTYTLQAATLGCGQTGSVISLDTNAGFTVGVSGGRVIDQSWAQGMSPMNIRSFDPDTGASTVLLDGPGAFVTSPVGTVLLNRNDGSASIVPAAGGTAVAISTGWPMGSGHFTHDGRSVLHISTNGAIIKAPSDGSPVTVLLGSGAANGAFVLSPDDNWLVYSTQLSGSSGRYIEDAWLLSTKSAAPAVALEASATIDQLPPGRIQFTDDSHWVLWVVDGVLHARPVDHDGEMVLGKGGTVLPAGGARVVWDDGSPWAPFGTQLSFLDLAAAGATPAVVATTQQGGVSWLRANWALSTDKQTLFYVKPDGVYAAPLP